MVTQASTDASIWRCTVVRVTDSSGAPNLAREYDAWGNLLASATAGYAFTGREWDAETNLYYYRARFYDSSTGRFLTEDPASLRRPGSAELRRVERTNLYRYVRNRPTELTDPTGLIAWKCKVGLFTIGGFPTLADMTAKCYSECCAGRQLVQVLQGAGTGASVGLPATVSYSEVVLHDSFGAPFKWSLPGFWAYTAIGGAAGVMGYAIASLTLGNATSGPSKPDWEAGFDGSFDAFSGVSISLGLRWEPCQCR
jgi:RHS repeat-associated protein